MVRNRVKRRIQETADLIRIYFNLFESASSITDVLETPYPLFYIIVKDQLKQKEEEAKKLKERREKIQTKYNKVRR